MGVSPHARSTRRCSGVPSADPRLTDLGTPEPPPEVVPVRPPLRRGLLAWLTLCIAYTVLDLAGYLDGLFVPVPLILALVLARVAATNPGLARGSRHVAVVVAAACVPAAAFVWRFGLTVADLSPGLLTAALLALGALIVLLLVPAVRVRFLRVFGLDPDSPVHRVVAIAFVITILDSIVLFLELSKAGPVEIPFYPSDPFISLMTDLALALAGVGLGLTRGVRATLARLDLRRSSLRQLGVALVVAAVLQLGVTLLEHLESVLLPTVAALEDRFGYDFV